jgi:hypothetical protein
MKSGPQPSCLCGECPKCKWRMLGWRRRNEGKRTPEQLSAAGRRNANIRWAGNASVKEAPVHEDIRSANFPWDRTGKETNWWADD